MNCAWTTTDEELLLEAEEWERAVSGHDPTVLLEFTSWVKKSPRHLQAYLAVVCLDTELNSLDPLAAFDLDNLLAAARDAG